MGLSSTIASCCCSLLQMHSFSTLNTAKHNSYSLGCCTRQALHLPLLRGQWRGQGTVVDKWKHEVNENVMQPIGNKYADPGPGARDKRQWLTAGACPAWWWHCSTRGASQDTVMYICMYMLPLGLGNRLAGCRSRVTNDLRSVLMLR